MIASVLTLVSNSVLLLSFNGVISSWARSGNKKSVARAEKVFEKLQSFVKPDLFSGGALLNAYAKAGMGEKSVETLLQFEDDNEKGLGWTPDVVIYNTVLGALGRDKRHEWTRQAEALVKKMKDLEKLGRGRIKPNQRTYSALLNVWSNSRTPEMVSKAHQLVMSMIESYENGDEDMKPTPATLTQLVKVCAYARGSSEDKSRALAIVVEVMEMLENSKYGQPTHFSYAMLMQAATRLSGQGRNTSELRESIFQNCISSKLLSKGFVNELKRAEIPVPRPLKPEWSQNVPARDRPSDLSLL